MIDVQKELLEESTITIEVSQHRDPVYLVVVAQPANPSRKTSTTASLNDTSEQCIPMRQSPRRKSRFRSPTFILSLKKRTVERMQVREPVSPK